LQDATHENDGPTSPHAGFYQVAGNLMRQNVLDTELNIVQTLAPDHRVGGGGPFEPFLSLLCLVGPDIHLQLSIDLIEQATLHQLKIESSGFISRAGHSSSFIVEESGTKRADLIRP